MDPDIGVGTTCLDGCECVSAATQEEVLRRVGLAVSPDDKFWIDIHQTFRDLLADGRMSIAQILSTFFTPHDVCLFTLSEPATLRAIQEDNTRRFHSLLQGRFQGVKADIPTKLTMLYFGLPIEPEALTDTAFNLKAGKSGSTGGAVGPPVRLLTAHKERNWENETLVGEQESFSPVIPPWRSLNARSAPRIGKLENGQPVVHLRGGGRDDDSDWAEDSFSGLSSSESDGEDAEGGADGDVSEDVDMKETGSDEDVLEKGAAPQSGNWINLYGFQGRVPFIPGDQQAYENAIRRLLSLGSQDREHFTIVHFDVKANTIDTIHDTLPLKPDSATLHFIAEKAKGGKVSPNKRHSFFVKLEKESVPEHWQPSEEQLSTIVSSVLFTPEEKHSPTLGTPASCCYLAFPDFHGSRPSLEAVCGWGADQCDEFLRTAFEVLLGRPTDLFHHAFFRLGRCDSDFATAPPTYGFSSFSSSELLSLIPAGDGTLSRLRCNKLGDDEIAFALPGFHFTSSLPLDGSGKDTATNLLSFVRQMISSAFSDSAKHIKYVRLLDGRATMGPEINRNQEYYSIRMSDDLPQNSEISFASALSKLVAAGNPFVLLHPEWEQDHSFLSMTGDNGVEHRVRMPPLSSTVDDLWSSVIDLMFQAGLDHRCHKELYAGDAFISIQPKHDYEPASAKVDAPCFFIAFETTDEQWFSIRARITTSVATIKTHSPKSLNWRAQIDRSCVWGPRYGSVAGVQSAVKRQARDDPDQEVIDDTSLEHVKEPVENAARETAVSSATSGAQKASTGDDKSTKKFHASSTTMLRRLGAATAGSKSRRRAWAVQPSIFDNYGRLPRLSGSGIRLPAYAPPVEHMLRTGPRMPMISKAILTPTEQGELQRITWDLRGLCLKRTLRCPYEGCQFAYRIDNQQAVVRHLEATHTGRKCMWCNDIIPGYWNAGNVHRHMREKHRDMLMEALGVNKATIRRFDGQGTISIPLKRVEKCEKPPSSDPVADEMDVDNPRSLGANLASDIAAFRQQQRDLRRQIVEAGFDAIESDEEGQDVNGMDLNDTHQEPELPELAQRPKEGGRVPNGTNHLADDLSKALSTAMEAAAVGLEAAAIANPDSTARQHDQRILREVVLRQLAKSASDEHKTSVRDPPDGNAPGRPPSRPSSPDPLAEEGEKETEGQEYAISPELEDPVVDTDSDFDDGSEFGGEDELGGHDSDGESDGELQGEALGAKRRKPRGRQRGRQGDRDYKYDGDEDDEEDSESDMDGQRARPPRRDPSPNWHRMLGPDDPNFEPTDEYYCSKCFRKAPKRHKRDRSPLGRAKEIELHYDSTRCCGIRRGIGSIKRLPNRSGWIPAAIMPKPLSNLRKQFLRRYPSYARTLYPLSATNANGTYWRSDPNNDDNHDWWSIPWPPYRGPSPLPNGWVAPEVADAPVAGKARQQFQLKPVADPTYRLGKGDVLDSDDDEDVESDKDVNGKRKRKSRPSSAFTSTKAALTPTKKAQKPTPEKADKTDAQGPLKRRKKTPMLQKVLKANVAASKKVTKKRKDVGKVAPVRRSMRKRQRTG